MHPYVAATRYAAENLFQTLLVESEKLAQLDQKLAGATAALQHYSWDFSTSDLTEDFSDAYVMRAFVRMNEARNTVQAADAARQSEEARLRAWIASNTQALDAIRTALLQIAKQGVSLAYKPTGVAPTKNGKWPSDAALQAAKPGRSVGAQPLKNVIWQARNQSIHYEDDDFSTSVKQCFAQLEKDFGSQFALVPSSGRSLSAEVFAALGWKDYATYVADLVSLLP